VQDPAFKDLPVKENPFMMAEMKVAMLFAALLMITHAGRLASAIARRHLDLRAAEFPGFALG
jgi:hypothetical protein